MLISTIVYDNSLKDFTEDIGAIKNYFDVKDIKLGIKEEIVNNKYFVNIYCSNYIEKDLYIKNNFYIYLSMVLYDFIVDEFCEKDLEDEIRDRYFFLKNTEIDFLINKIKSVLKSEKVSIKSEDVYYINIKNSILRNISSCIEESNEFNINGFLNFRSRGIKEELTSISDSVIQNYISEKEYREFIKLLKYFVDVQESKIDEVNIIVTDRGEYVLKDKKGEEILNEFLKDLEEVKFTGTIGMEDIIISGLITNVPKRIVIHCKEHFESTEFINTIKDVFMERVAFCTGCEFCKINKYRVKL
ncbi:putative sporulation protein YtxC [Hathewaya massiliensis]|uniref:putative sporulation protein YtxC n=1 Tax=Hathewaya massiliensis TaxID=1964382 RepID=UPI001159D46E|nr:putative sporulation protein YtxC [Hathewaya massiliensis]